jgi:hypothetical protein
MQPIGFLLIWAVSWLPAGEYDRSPIFGKELGLARPLAGAEIGLPSGARPASPALLGELTALLSDGEDSSDGDVCALGLAIEVPARIDVSALFRQAREGGDAGWTSCQRHPLRC